MAYSSPAAWRLLLDTETIPAVLRCGVLLRHGGNCSLTSAYGVALAFGSDVYLTACAGQCGAAGRSPHLAAFKRFSSPWTETLQRATAWATRISSRIPSGRDWRTWAVRNTGLHRLCISCMAAVATRTPYRHKDVPQLAPRSAFCFSLIHMNMCVSSFRPRLLSTWTSLSLSWPLILLYRRSCGQPSLILACAMTYTTYLSAALRWSSPISLFLIALYYAAPDEPSFAAY